MSLLESFDKMQLVKTGPSLSERLERRIAAAHQKIIVHRLRVFRKQLEVDMEPEPWTLLKCPAVLLLSDICDALELLESEKEDILGAEGAMALQCELAVRSGELNVRQLAALACVRKHGEITLKAYRAICPHWSDETLRLDLASLVEQGLLIKNGAKKGTRYILARE